MTLALRKVEKGFGKRIIGVSNSGPNSTFPVRDRIRFRFAFRIGGKRDPGRPLWAQRHLQGTGPKAELKLKTKHQKGLKQKVTFVKRPI